MRKIKVYLDTSVIGYLDQQDEPEKMNDTIIFWSQIKEGLFDVFVSDLTLFEIANAHEAKRELLRSFLGEIQYIYVERNEEALRLSQLYHDIGGLPTKSRHDAIHIAIATVNGCNVILSWNFKHIVNLRAIHAVDTVNLKERYSQIRILTPTMIIESEE